MCEGMSLSTTKIMKWRCR